MHSGYSQHCFSQPKFRVLTIAARGAPINICLPADWACKLRAVELAARLPAWYAHFGRGEEGQLAGELLKQMRSSISAVGTNASRQLMKMGKLHCEMNGLGSRVKGST
jgi:hypothetical protein